MALLLFALAHPALICGLAAVFIAGGLTFQLANRPAGDGFEE